MTPPVRAAALLALVPGLLGATYYRRTTDQACSTCAYWATRAPTYVVNASARTAPQDCPADVTAVVQTSFDAWNGSGAGSQTKGCTDLALTYAGASTSHAIGVDGTNLVLFRKGPCDVSVSKTDACWNDETCGNRYNCWDTGVSGGDTSPRSDLMLALTWVAYDRRSGRILDADMELNDWGGNAGSLTGSVAPADGWYLTCTNPAGTAYPASNQCTAYAQAACTYADLQSTVTHEAGHFIGLAHPDVNPDGTPATCDPTCAATTMYSKARLGDIGKRSLEQGDIEGVCTIYPLGAPPLTCPLQDTGSCPRATTGCGCGTGTGGAGAIALLAILLAIPRRRRV